MSGVVVSDLPLDLDSFEGPFDLLLTLVLREELELPDVAIAEIVPAFLERLAERDELDLDACGEFLVLVSALLDLKARALFGGETDLEDLEPEEAANELAERLAAYRRIRAAALWLEERLASEGDRWFRIGPAPLAPVPAPAELPRQEPALLSAAFRRLAAVPPAPSLGHLGTFPPVARFLERFRAVLSRRRSFLFDSEVESLSRVEQAVAFLALLELRRSGEATLRQLAPFEPISVCSSQASA